MGTWITGTQNSSLRAKRHQWISAIVTGAGPSIVSNIDSLGPYFAPEHCLVYGTRDHLHDKDFIETPYPPALKRLDIQQVYALGGKSVTEALARVTQPGLDGFWVHLDVDVPNDDIMPAVDYRMKDGLSWDELSASSRPRSPPARPPE